MAFSRHRIVTGNRLGFRVRRSSLDHRKGNRRRHGGVFFWYPLHCFVPLCQQSRKPNRSSEDLSFSRLNNESVNDISSLAISFPPSYIHRVQSHCRIRLPDHKVGSSSRSCIVPSEEGGF